MAKIALSEGFTVIPEGTHIFKITEVTYKETFGKIEVKMETAKGLKHTERFSLIGKNGQPNEGAMNAFSFFAKTALDDFELTEIDPNDLVGRYMECVVEHDVQPSNKNPNKNVIFIRLADKSPAYGFDEAEVTPPATKKTAPAKAKGTPVTSKTGGINLDDLLG